jgi:prephenate dehydrogenase
MDWLKFRFNSELPKEDPQIKGLHRGQLMLAMFAATGYTFKSGKGFVRKDTGEIIADKPQSAMEVFNDEYKPKAPLTLEIINNYNKLMDYVKNNLKPEDKDATLNMFREALKRAEAYVPDNI